MQDTVDFQTLRLGKIIDVVNHLAVFVDGGQRIGLFARRAPTGSAHGWDDGLVGVDVARGQEKFHLGGDDRGPALIGVQFHNAAQHVARRERHQNTLLVFGVMDDL